jgi:hypothetical protein
MAKLKSGTRVYGTAGIDTSLTVGSGVTITTTSISVTGIITAPSIQSTSIQSTTVNATTVSATTITGVTTAGITTAYIGSVNDGPLAGTRNRVINGDFEIWQRGTSVTYLNGSTAFYLADRWSGAPEYQNARHQRVSVTSPIAGMTARYALRASSSTSAEAASGTRISLGQKIENLNCYDLAGKQVTLSFYVKFSSATSSASSGTYGNWQYYLAYDGTTTDASFNTTSPPTSTSSVYLNDGSLPTTWTKYTLTTTVPSGTNNISVRFQFDNLKNTSSADTTYYDITNIQLESGTVATPFERRSYGQELALCQRYYERRTFNSSDTVGAGGANTGNTAQPWCIFHWVTEKRASPTCSLITAASTLQYMYRGNAFNATSFDAFLGSTPTTTALTYTLGSASGTVGGWTRANGTLIFDASIEL